MTDDSNRSPDTRIFSSRKRAINNINESDKRVSHSYCVYHLSIIAIMLSFPLPEPRITVIYVKAYRGETVMSYVCFIYQSEDVCVCVCIGVQFAQLVGCRISVVIMDEKRNGQLVMAFEYSNLTLHLENNSLVWLIHGTAACNWVICWQKIIFSFLTSTSPSSGFVIYRLGLGLCLCHDRPVCLYFVSVILCCLSLLFSHFSFTPAPLSFIVSLSYDLQYMISNRKCQLKRLR